MNVNVDKMPLLLIKSNQKGMGALGCKQIKEQFFKCISSTLQPDHTDVKYVIVAMNIKISSALSVPVTCISKDSGC